ncbi:MAG: hypothetical protein M5U19_20255 [Microthrixaceae bacterium]|nr:hypothetical protein [Microthrixaceae bacterium]
MSGRHHEHVTLEQGMVIEECDHRAVTPHLVSRHVTAYDPAEHAVLWRAPILHRRQDTGLGARGADAPLPRCRRAETGDGTWNAVRALP